MGAGVMKKGLKAFATATLLLLWLPHIAPAQEPPSELPALINADRVTYDENLGIVTASGNVELAQDNRVLLADSVSFNTRTNVVTASGNVSLADSSGEVIFANYVELTDDLREGFIRDIRVLLTDRSRLAAVSGVRTGGNKTVLKKGVYSPCELCRDDPTRAPLWQLKALEVEHDQEEQVVRYRDAWMEIYGIPVFYTPYLEHADPTVKRKSGFLAPTVGSSEILGTTYQQPYFWNIAPDKDATIAPIFTTNQGVTLAGEYRQLFTNGRIDLRGSGALNDREKSNGEVDKNRIRGHIDSTARFDIDDTWRWGVDAQRATDDTYLRIYNFASEASLTSRAFVEGLNGRDYFAVNNYLYQGQRSTDIDGETPMILPMIDYNYISDPGIAGSKYTLDANLLALTRREGRDSRRLSVAAGWELPYLGPAGDIYTIMARVQGDGYWTDGVRTGSDDVNPSGSTDSNLTGRIFPQVALQWRYPWVQNSGSIHQVIEPIAQAVAAPNGSNPGKIPNEDSIDFEFDDTNLLSLNRFPGTDRVDPGSRFDYGLKWTLTDDDGGYSSAFVGQSYRLQKDDLFADGTGLTDHFSDIVGRVDLKPTEDVSLLYRFRLDKNDLQAQRSELNLSVGPKALNLNIGYFFVNSDDPDDEFGDREEVTWNLRSQFSRYWSVFGGQRIDLNLNETRQTRLGLTYQDECFVISAIALRNTFSDREIKPEDSIFVNFVFKNLGGVSTASVAGFGG